MTGPGWLVLRADWAGRADPLDVQIAMMRQCWQALTGCGGLLAGLWYSRKLAPEPNRPIDSAEALAEDMAETLRRTTVPFYLFTQEAVNDVSPAGPFAWLWASIGNRGEPGPVANSVILHLDPGEDGGWPVDWLIGLGPGLVKAFVDAWRPDSVVLTDEELETGFVVEVGDEEWVNARPGYFLWLAGGVVPAGGMPAAPLRESYGGGVLIGVDPAAGDPSGQAEEIDWIPLLDCNATPSQD